MKFFFRKTIITKIIIVLFLMIDVAGCSNSKLRISSDQENSFRQLIQINDLNNSMRIRIYSNEGDGFKFGSTISIGIENISTQPIFVSSGAPAIKVYVIRNNEWLTITNKSTYMTEEGILDPKGGALSVWPTWVHPVLVPDSESVGGEEIVRVVVLGEFMRNGLKNGIPVGAYVDLLMKP